MNPLSNPWVLLGIVLALALSHAAVGKWQREDGRTAERVVWQTRENAELAASKKRIQELLGAARKAEQDNIAAMSALATNYWKGFQDAEARRKRDLDAARSGGLVLRVPASVCRDASGSSASPSGASSSGSHGPAAVELPRQVTLDLLNLAADADAVADQLRACQTIILMDRKQVQP